MLPFPGSRDSVSADGSAEFFRRRFAVIAHPNRNAWLISNAFLGGLTTVLTRMEFDKIKNKHGDYASWAVWAPAGVSATSNIGDTSVLDPDQNSNLLSTLNPNVVMLGLNISRPVDKPLSNFHDKNPLGKDYKIRHAFWGTRFYGAYMTDVLKFFVEVESSKVMSTVRKRPDIVQASAEKLREEFQDLGTSQPEIIAFGGNAADLTQKVLGPGDYSRLVKVTHYSHFIGADEYRSQVLAQCGKT